MRKILLTLFVLFGIIFFLYEPIPANAAFNNAYLKLDSQMPNSALSGTVCAEPSTVGAGVENSVTVTFPSDFTISANTSDWTANTSNLSSGETVWTGIGITATNVSGQSVTFASEDLTSSNLYCFNFTGTSSTTGALGDGKTGTIVTKNSSNETIDSTIYSTSIVTNNQIQITASIDPHVSDLPITIESANPGIQFPQGTTLSYAITYGTNTIGSVPLTIQAEWTQGTINGSPTPSVDILDYVIGSATNAYGSSPPVIDSINRTITWTIPTIPGGTVNQTVTFSLKTNNSYTGGNNVSFDILARAISGATVTPDQTITQNYLYNPLLSPTITPAPTSTTTTSTTITASPAPTSTPSALSISGVSISEISKSDAQISVLTNINATLTIDYGSSIDSLNKKVQTLSPQTTNLVTLNDLAPDTDYYFRVTAEDSNGNTVKSDIFTFRTAVISETPTANLQSLVVTSQDNILINPAVPIPAGEIKNGIVIPISSIFEIQFSLNKTVSVKSIQAIVRNKKVLGVNTFDTLDANSNLVNFVETSPGVYTGKLKSLPTPGFYEIYARIIDFNGNISEQKIADLIITQKLSVFDKTTKNPLENARVLLYLYNEKTRLYDIISPDILPIPNPSFSLPDGTLNLVLPIGKYKVETSAIGYDSETSEFAISTNVNSYPQIYLTKQPFSLMNSVNYYTSIFLDTLTISQNYLRSVATSNRVFNLLTGIALLCFVLIVFLSFSARTHIPFLFLPYFFIYKLKLMFEKTKSSVIVGKITEKGTDVPVSKANVYLIDGKLDIIIGHAKTDKLGDFYFNKPKIASFKISIMKKGFLSGPFFEFESEGINAMPLNLNLEKDTSHIKSLLEIGVIYAEDLFGVILEFLIILSLVFETFFIGTFGFAKIAPYLILTTINFALLFLFLYKPKNLNGSGASSFSYS